MSVTKIASSGPIVMVDDNEGDIYIARRCFGSSKLTNPWIYFTNGPDFLEHLKSVKAGAEPMPALVLLDINMPGMSGLDVLRHTRADPYFADLPIFCMLTSSSDPRDERNARELGASGFTTKPARIADYVAFFDGLRSDT